MFTVIELIDKNAKMPVRVYEHDSGFDCFSPKSILLKKGERETIMLGIKIEIHKDEFMPYFVEAQIRPKSGLTKVGIDVPIGTVDFNYRGEIGVCVINNSNDNYSIKMGQKICQLVFVPVITNITLEQGKVKEDTARGTGGFGSTGLK